LKEPDGVITVFQDEPVLRRVAGEGLEAELFVEGFGSLDVFDGQADGECA